MLVNKTLAQFSDWSYFTAFAFYLVAFVISIAYYSRRIAAAEAKSQVAERELVAAGAGEGATTASVADSGESATKSSASEPKNQVLTNRLGVVTEMLIYVGVAVHFASVLLRGLAVQRFPWGNLYEYVSVSILFAMAIAAGVLHRETMRVFWPWLLAPILALMFYGGKNLYVEAAPVVPALQSIWIPVHVSIISIGCSIALISGVASILYMLRMYNREGKERASWANWSRRCRMLKSWMRLLTAPLFGPSHCSVWALCWALSGPSPHGVVTGAGTRRRPRR